MQDNKNKLKKYIRKYTFLTSLTLSLFVICIFLSNSGFDYLYQSNTQNLEIKDNFGVSTPVIAAGGRSAVQNIILKVDNPEKADSSIRAYLRDIYPLISDNDVDKIISTKSINKFYANDAAGSSGFYYSIYVPKYFLDSVPKILWELNLPELKSRFYQIYEGDTILIDTWNCSVGNPKTKTYTGHFHAYKIRNWPTWKDPDSDSPPVSPGPYNPLGLFTVHFDENSTRQFHGTNVDNVQINSYGAVSHGCIRNNNDNMAKLKKFIIKKVIKSEDLSYWLESKQTMLFELKEEDKLPINIVYKTFDINKDESGDYIIFFKDIYNYNQKPLTDVDDPSLITTTTVENILNELRWERPSIHISDERLIPILEKLISDHEDYQKYYFKDIISDILINS